MTWRAKPLPWRIYNRLGRQWRNRAPKENQMGNRESRKRVPIVVTLSKRDENEDRSGT
jgi:hypothetical protein